MRLRSTGRRGGSAVGLVRRVRAVGTRCGWMTSGAGFTWPTGSGCAFGAFVVDLGALAQWCSWPLWSILCGAFLGSGAAVLMLRFILRWAIRAF